MTCEFEAFRRPPASCSWPCWPRPCFHWLSRGTTLFADLGGTGGIDRIVDAAVALFLSDDRIKLDFDNINPDRLRSRLKSKLCQVADGPCDYKGRPWMRRIMAWR